MIELKSLFRQLKNINLGRFSQISKTYVIGDIHGDLNKFVLFLKSINIIKSSSLPDKYDAYRVSIKQMKEDVKKYIVFNDVSNLRNICIVQLGDIIDGHNTCFNSAEGFINNDIMVYAIIDEVIKLLKRCYNCHFILIAGNHDIENIFDIYGVDNKVNGSLCNLNDKYSYWAQYVLNSDEVYASDKVRIVYDKLTKRRDYLQNDFDILHNVYFIVSINDETIFSHTVFYKTILKRLSEIDGLDIKDEDLVEYLNGLFKICMIKVKESAEGNMINSGVFSDIVEGLFKMVSSRSKEKHKIKNEEDVVYYKGPKHYFVGHEVQNEFKKIKHNMFNFYVYYIDIGISKSLYDKNTLTNYYYVIIDYDNNKKVSIHKCSDKKCVDF